MSQSRVSEFIRSWQGDLIEIKRRGMGKNQPLPKSSFVVQKPPKNAKRHIMISPAIS